MPKDISFPEGEGQITEWVEEQRSRKRIRYLRPGDIQPSIWANDSSEIEYRRLPYSASTTAVSRPSRSSTPLAPKKDSSSIRVPETASHFQELASSTEPDSEEVDSNPQPTEVDSKEVNSHSSESESEEI